MRRKTTIACYCLILESSLSRPGVSMLENQVVASLVYHAVKLRIETLVRAFLQARSGNPRSHFADDICEG